MQKMLGLRTLVEIIDHGMDLLVRSAEHELGGNLERGQVAFAPFPRGAWLEHLHPVGRMRPFATRDGILATEPVLRGRGRLDGGRETEGQCGEGEEAHDVPSPMAGTSPDLIGIVS